MRPDKRKKMVVQRAYLDNRSSLLKNFWIKYAKLENLTAHAAPRHRADQNWLERRRQHNDVGAGL